MKTKIIKLMCAVIACLTIISLCACGSSQKELNPNEWVCDSCDTINKDNFCTNCGAQKPDTTWICSYCKGQNDASAKFCSNCGKEKVVLDSKALTESDDMKMGEIANAIQLILSNQGAYDEVLYSTAKGNVSCYIDKSNESEYSDLKVITKAASSNSGDKDQYTLSDNARLADGTEYYFAGNLRGMTITFVPKNGTVTVGDAIINAGLMPEAKVTSDRVATDLKYYGGSEWTGKKLSELSSKPTNEGQNTLYNKVRESIGKDTLTLESETYRNSNYTIFIRMDTDIQVYGQWNGKNLK